CITFVYSGNTVTYTTARADDSNEWLRQDLGAPGVGSFVDLFQWGRWDDGHQVLSPGNLNSGSASPNNPTAFTATTYGPNPYYYGTPWWSGGGSGSTWDGAVPADITSDRALSPCKQLLGSDWRVPSISEWSNIFSVEGIT